jgi:hypothetical protein
MSPSPSLAAIGLATLRLTPLVLSATNVTMSAFIHVSVTAFTEPSVGPASRAAAIPGWWLHLRNFALPLIGATYVPNILLGLLNAYRYSASGLLGGGAGGGDLSTLATRFYLSGAIISAAYFASTFVQGLVPLNHQMMDAKEPPARREVALAKFLQRDYIRAVTTAGPAFVCFLVGATLWAAELL